MRFEIGRFTNLYTSGQLKAKLLPSGPVAASLDYFTVGSSKDEVLALQGSPKSFTETEWNYGASWVRFENGRVTNWYTSGQLKAELVPSGPVPASLDYFTVGSTKDEVLAMQGSPISFTETEWNFGASWVRFENGRVTNWYNNGQLKARLEP